MDLAILSKELLKARKRLAEQDMVLHSCREIIASTLTLPSLKRIAQARLPKLLATFEDTTKVVAELEKALEVPVQTDIESAAPSQPLVKSPPRR